MGKMIQIGSDKIDAYLAEPNQTIRGGLLLIHEVWGLDEHNKQLAEKFCK